MKRIITVSLVILSLLLTFCGCGLSDITDITEFSSYLPESSYVTATGTVKVSDITSIEVNWVSGSVKIEESDTDSVTFSEVSSKDTEKDSLGEATENKELTESLKMRYKTDNGKLTIQFCKSGLRVRTGAVKDLKKDLTIYVPKGTELTKIKTDVVSADIYMTDLSSSNIEMNGVSSNMKLVCCKTEYIKCDTVSGNLDITADEVLEKTDMNTVSGDLTISAQSVNKLNVKGVSADVGLKLQKFDFALSLTGISSKFSAEGIAYEKTGDNKYKFGDGTGSVSLESVSGSVRLEEK